jgi:spermidine synthase
VEQKDKPTTRRGHRQDYLLGPLATAFVSGAVGILVEVIGARALAPFFGGSLIVWTAQITATLLFLAIGYEVGGRLSRNSSSLHLPVLFFAAAAWLALYPIIRSPVLGIAAATMGIGSGSFISGTILFGIPLLCIGAVSPVLVGQIDRSRPGAGSAAGSLFFISTLGGLAGGWIAVFVVIPLLSVRLCIVGSGVTLALVGAIWSLVRGSAATALLCTASLAAGVLGIPATASVVRTTAGVPVKILYSRQSDAGLVRVIDGPADAPVRRTLLINGILQGGIDLNTDMPYAKFIGDLAYLGRSFRPDAKDALVLGLGAGLLAKELAARGIHVTAAELDPRVVYVARTFFGLPPAVDARIGDARVILRKDKGAYDLIYLDAFQGEYAPWYLTTVEMFRNVRSHLRTGGTLVINTVTDSGVTSPGATRMIAGLHAVFRKVMVFQQSDRPGIHNVFLVAGADLHRRSQSVGGDPDAGALIDVTAEANAQAGARSTPGTDDRSDIDYADVATGEALRRPVIAELGADILGD